ncbi:MAG: hypothetical protein F6J93_18870 [Oscillatoria sp. SIO1A7]|nr:hypothetical protein [Oscillatoria sp. SIO1A7]
MSESETFIKDSNYTGSTIGGIDDALPITPTLEHFMDMSDGESEEDKRPNDIYELTLTNNSFQQDLEEFVEGLQNSDAKYNIERSNSKSGYFEVLRIEKPKALTR